MAFMVAVVMFLARVPMVVPMVMMNPVVPMVMTLVKPLVMMPIVMVPMVRASIEEKRVINNQREDTKEEPGAYKTSKHLQI